MEDRRQAVLAKARVLRLSRRAAIRRMGGGLAATLAAFGGRVAIAEDAGTPAASGTPALPAGTGLYAAVRRYQLAKGKSLDELVRLVETGFVPIVRAVPGFVEYYLIVDAATGAQVSVSIFQSKAAADESTQRAAAWVAANVASFNEGPPEVTAGALRIHVTAAPATPTA